MKRVGRRTKAADIRRFEQILGALVSLAGVAVLFLDRLDVSIQQAIGVAM